MSSKYRILEMLELASILLQHTLSEFNNLDTTNTDISVANNNILYTKCRIDDIRVHIESIEDELFKEKEE